MSNGDSSKNMVTFLKKKKCNQKVSVCTTAINARGLRTTHATHHLPQQDHLLNLVLKANIITLDLTHISHHCHFFLQIQTTDKFAIIFGQSVAQMYNNNFL